MKSLYVTDVLAWSEQQADAMRRLAGSNAADEADWEHVACSLERVGQWAHGKVETGLRAVLVQAVAGYCDPDTLRRPERSHRTLLGQRGARREISATIRTRLDLDRLWREAFALAVTELEDDFAAQKALGLVIDPEASSINLPPGLPRTCPFTLDELVAEDFTYDRAVEQLYVRLTSWRPPNKDEGL